MRVCALEHGLRRSEITCTEREPSCQNSVGTVLLRSDLNQQYQRVRHRFSKCTVHNGGMDLPGGDMSTPLDPRWRAATVRQHVTQLDAQQTHLDTRGWHQPYLHSSTTPNSGRKRIRLDVRAPGTCTAGALRRAAGGVKRTDGRPLGAACKATYHSDGGFS